MLTLNGACDFGAWSSQMTIHTTISLLSQSGNEAKLKGS